MKIRFRKQAYGAYGEASPGDERDVAKALARELVANGIADEIGGEDDTGDDEDGGEELQPVAITEQADASTPEKAEDGSAHDEDVDEEHAPEHVAITEEASGSTADETEDAPEPGTSAPDAEDTPASRRAARRRRAG